MDIKFCLTLYLCVHTCFVYACVCVLYLYSLVVCVQMHCVSVCIYVSAYARLSLYARVCVCVNNQNTILPTSTHICCLCIHTSSATLQLCLCEPMQMYISVFSSCVRVCACVCSVMCVLPSGGQCVTRMSVLSGTWFHLSSRA